MFYFIYFSVNTQYFKHENSLKFFPLKKAESIFHSRIYTASVPCFQSVVDAVWSLQKRMLQSQKTRQLLLTLSRPVLRNLEHKERLCLGAGTYWCSGITSGAGDLNPGWQSAEEAIWSCSGSSPSKGRSHQSVLIPRHAREQTFRWCKPGA